MKKLEDTILFKCCLKVLTTASELDTDKEELDVFEVRKGWGIRKLLSVNIISKSNGDYIQRLISRDSQTSGQELPKPHGSGNQFIYEVEER